jgi:hypothetical protein
MAIQKDTFCMALIDQVDITAERNFELIPKLGNNVIVFGNATNIDAKLNKIKVFYKEVMVKAGWNYYSIINVQYKNQVVAKRKGADDKSADSLRTIQMMQQIAANAERMANDSLQQIAIDNDRNTTDNSMIDQSVQRDESEDAPAMVEKTLTKESQPALVPFIPRMVVTPKAATPPVAKPVDKKPDPAPAKKPVDKPVVAHPKPIDSKPKQKPVVQTTKPQTTKPTPKKKTEPSNDY